MTEQVAVQFSQYTYEYIHYPQILSTNGIPISDAERSVAIAEGHRPSVRPRLFLCGCFFYFCGGRVRYAKFLTSLAPSLNVLYRGKCLKCGRQMSCPSTAHAPGI